MKTKYIILAFLFFPVILFGQLEVAVRYSLEGEYEISYDVMGAAGENTAVIDFRFERSDSVSSVTLNVIDKMSGTGPCYFYDSYDDYHYGGRPTDSFLYPGVYNLDVSDGDGCLYITTCYIDATVSWTSNINLEGNVWSESGCIYLENNNSSNDISVRDYSKKSMGALNSTGSAYNNAMLLLEQPNNSTKLGLSPNKISSNTSLGISSNRGLYCTAEYLYFNTGATNAMLINSSGNVGIGTWPDTELHVHGTTKLEGDVYNTGTFRTREVIVEVDDGTWPDYVFSEDFSLLSLSDVEKHIKEYGHLPAMPSAQTVEEQGVSVGEINKLLLQKIEEMMLYILEQDKRIQDLESKVK